MNFKQQFKPDLRRMRAEGFLIGINSPVNSGPTLTVVGIQEAAEEMSNRPKLAQYSQIEIKADLGYRSVFIGTERLLDRPQIIIGFTPCGFPILLGLKSTEGHLTLVGPTGSGKSLNIGLIVYQLSRQGYPVFIIGCKSFDPVLYASIKAGCESLTWLDAAGKPVARTAELFTLQPGLKSKAFNPLAQKRNAAISKIAQSGTLVRAVTSGNPASDPSARYFSGASVDVLLKVDHGRSPRQLAANIEKLNLDKDAKYATAGVRQELAQIAAVEHVNRPLEDPTSIDIERILKSHGSAFFDVNAVDMGTTATSISGLFVQSIIATKRAVCLTLGDRIFIIIDEAQIFPREYLKQLIEQARGSGVTLILAYHTLEQMGDQWETISITQGRIILGAVPGGSTDRHLQSLFGTRKVWRHNLSQGSGTSHGTSVTHSSGPVSSSVSHGYSDSTSQQSSFGFTETEEQVWTPNHTLELNHHRENFVCMVSPGAEMAHWGPGAILGVRNGLHLSFEEINRLSKEALGESPGADVPTASQAALNLPQPPAPHGDETRAHWMSILNATADRIRRSLG